MERGSSALNGLDPESSVVVLDNALDACEANAFAGNLHDGSVFRPAEDVEHVGQVFRCDADAGVLDGKKNLVAGPLGSDEDFAFAFVPHVFHAVIDEILKDLPEPGLFTVHDRKRAFGAEGDPVHFEIRAEPLCHRRHKMAQMDPLDFLAA